MFDRAVRPRRFRRPRPYWLLSAAAAVLAGAITAGTVQRAEQAVADYGTTTRVAVAATDLEIGETLDASDVAWRDLPAVFVVGTPVEDPVGRTVVEPVLQGEPLAGERLSPGGLSPTEALIGRERRALVIDLADDTGPFVRGDRVDLLATGADLSSEARWVSRDATVIEVGETSATVAVDERDAPATARAALDGAIVLALIGEPD